MKQLNILLAAVLLCITASAQTDSTNTKKTDTLRIGNIIIIKNGKGHLNDTAIKAMNRINFERKQKSRISTDWLVVDLGFANYSDNTNYANAGGYLVSNPAAGSLPLSKGDFKLRAGKSVDVNIWLFMQKINLIKKNVSLKYGLGIELNNYRYKSSISYRENGTLPYGLGQTNDAFIFRDSINFSKNKLAADYLTIPVMLNFASTPHFNRQGVNFSAGVSAGYLYSQRNKQKSDEFGKLKNKGDYDLEKFKLSYVAELGVGPITFYGSYSPKSMYEHSLDMKPFTFGIRINNR